MNNLRCRRHAWKHKEDEEEERKTRNDDSKKT